MSALVVATWNIHGAVGLDRRCRPARIARVLSNLGADVVALQEVRSASGAFEHVCRAFGEPLGYQTIAGPTWSTPRAGFGNLVLLRRTPRAHGRLVLDVGAREPRAAIDVRLDLDGAPLRLIATHLGLSSAERREQVGRLRRQLAADATPTILLGDFNEPRRYGSLAALAPLLALAPSPATFPSLFPLLRLDRILVTPSLRASLQVPRDPLARIASDHLPLLARIERVPDRIGSVERSHAGWQGHEGGGRLPHGGAA